MLPFDFFPLRKLKKSKTTKLSRGIKADAINPMICCPVMDTRSWLPFSELSRDEASGGLQDLCLATWAVTSAGEGWIASRASLLRAALGEQWRNPASPRTDSPGKVSEIRSSPGPGSGGRVWGWSRNPAIQERIFIEVRCSTREQELRSVKVVIPICVILAMQRATRCRIRLLTLLIRGLKRVRATGSTGLS